MFHRGPDGGGHYESPDGCLGVVSRRLAIRDLSPAGHMPMFNAQGTVGIVYNGEVYNGAGLRAELEGLGYHFRSSSDTEIILHGYEAWGADVVLRLNGMFAFAIVQLDATGQTVQQVFLARDHLGIKPLYYAQTAEGVVWASEIKTLLASGLVAREVDPGGLVGYMLLGSTPNPLTIYRGIRALEPASAFTLRPERLEVTPQRYWSLPTSDAPQDGVSEADYAAQTRELLRDAVRRQLVSDVPLGAFLSGGLDSSAVVALMREATDSTLRTCSMTFGENKLSEASYARAVAEAVGAEHFERVVTPQDVAGELTAILRALDQPSVDGVNTYFVSQTAKQAGLTVALSGLGGDELFGGYPSTFGGVPQMMRALTLAHRVPGAHHLVGAAVGMLPDRHRWARFRHALSAPPSHAAAYYSRRGLFAPQEARALVEPSLWQEGIEQFNAITHIAEKAQSVRQDGQIRESEARDGNDDAFGWTSRAELRTYTHHQLLRDTDAMSMAHSLEVRVPLLDTALVEGILRLPTPAKREGEGPKPLLRRAIGEMLPPIVRDRSDKQGFIFPFEQWLRGPLREQVRDVLAHVPEQGWLQPQAVERALSQYEAGRLHWSRIWTLVALSGFALD